ncbi:MAG: hypothetical protein HOA21_08795, partial [Rhodospirillaceae bacterium]|nr:hypothetical protein [Rhodospirillaceae bacterium]
MRALMQLFKPKGAVAKPTRRRTSRAALRRRYGIMALSVVIFLGGLGAGAWQLWQSGIVDQAYTKASDAVTAWGERQVQNAGLTVQHVFVTGRGETSKKQVL